MKNRYQVTATMTTDLYVEVMAESEEEALQIARVMDGSEFVEVFNGGDWEIGHATEIEEEGEIA